MIWGRADLALCITNAMLRKAFPERMAIVPRYELTGAGIMNVTHDSAERLNERENPKHR